MTANDFLRRIENPGLDTLDRAVALLWWAGRDDPTSGMTPKAICNELELAGHPKQNVSRLASLLKADRRTSKAGKDGWRLHLRARQELDTLYAFALRPRPPAPSDSILPRQLFAGTRGYIERVVEQINKSYDAELWDCCAVMCRRLIETLIIETYEKAGRANEIKGSDGNFMMLNGLVTSLDQDTTIHLGRSAARGLKDFKQLGDLSAHNRRFNAHRNDIDRIRDGLRVATQEFLHLAGLGTNLSEAP